MSLRDPRTASSSFRREDTVQLTRTSSPRFYVHQLLPRATTVRFDSEAGITATAVAHFSGRHIETPLYFPMVVWSVCFMMVALGVSSFRLAYHARKEFRIRLREQTQALMDLETQGKRPVLTRKEMNSFTRQSIIMLNRPSTKLRDGCASRLSETLDVPQNLFNRPPRDSILVAEVSPQAGFPPDDLFYQFSRQVEQPGFWSSGLRASRSISLAVMLATPNGTGPQPNPNAMLPMSDFLPEERRNDTFPPRNPRPVRLASALATSHEEGFSGSPRVKAPIESPMKMMPSRVNREFSTEPVTPSDNRTRTPSRRSLASRRHLSTESTLVGCSPIEEQDHFKTPTKAPNNDEESSVECKDYYKPTARKSSLRRPQRHSSIPSLDTGSLIQLQKSPLISPDEAVAQYAMARANSPSPIPQPLRSSPSILGRLGRNNSTSRRTEPQEPAQTVPLEISEPFNSNGLVRRGLRTGDIIKNPVHSIIFEEDESALEKEPFVFLSPISVGVTQDTSLPYQKPTTKIKHDGLTGDLPLPRNPLSTDSGYARRPSDPLVPNLKRTPSKCKHPATGDTLKRSSSVLARLLTESTRPQVRRTPSRVRKSPNEIGAAGLEQANSKERSEMVPGNREPEVEVIKSRPPLRVLTQQALQRGGSSSTARVPLSGTMSSGGVRDSSFIV